MTKQIHLILTLNVPIIRRIEHATISNSLSIPRHGVTNKKVIMYSFYSKINKWNNDDKLFTDIILQNLTYVL
jgi:hypothetical protein